MRDRAQTVIVGAGIVGASAAYHLAELGVTDVLVLDQGPLFETGGSTSHAPGLVFQTNGSRTMCRIAQDSVALYDALDLDGRARLVRGRRPRARDHARADGGAEAPPGVRARPTGSRGPSCSRPPSAPSARRCWTRRRSSAGTGCPTDGAGKGWKIAAALGRRAEAAGVALRGWRHRHRASTSARAASTGSARTAATWPANASCSAPGSGARASATWPGVPIPLVAVQHQLVWTDPVPGLEGLDWATHPIVRHQDMSLYYRQREDHYGVGNYRHEPIAHAAGATSARRAARCSPR